MRVLPALVCDGRKAAGALATEMLTVLPCELTMPAFTGVAVTVCDFSRWRQLRKRFGGRELGGYGPINLVHRMQRQPLLLRIISIDKRRSEIGHYPADNSDTDNGGPDCGGGSHGYGAPQYDEGIYAERPKSDECHHRIIGAHPYVEEDRCQYHVEGYGAGTKLATSAITSIAIKISTAFPVGKKLTSSCAW